MVGLCTDSILRSSALSGLFSCLEAHFGVVRTIADTALEVWPDGAQIVVLEAPKRFRHICPEAASDMIKAGKPRRTIFIFLSLGVGVVMVTPLPLRRGVVRGYT